jgi:putative transposase
MAKRKVPNKWKGPVRVVRYELDPNNKEISTLKAHARMARYAWNWGLGNHKQWLDIPKDERGPYPSNKILMAMWTEWVNSDRGKQRFQELGIAGTARSAVEGGIFDLQKSLKAYYNNKKKKKKDQRKVGFPKWRKFIPSQESFHAYGTVLRAMLRTVTLPTVGTVRTKETTHIERADILGVTVKRETDRWFISFRLKDRTCRPGKRHEPTIAIHLGLRHFATIRRIDGATPSIDSESVKEDIEYHKETYRILHPRPFERILKKLRRVDRTVSRRRLGRPMKPNRKPVRPVSNNYKKSREWSAKINFKVRKIRKDFLHRVTTYLAKTYKTIIIEDWRIDKMLEQKKYSRAIADRGWRIFWSMLEYKCPKFGSDLLVLDTGFPSSKKCSSCGNVKEDFPLNQKIYNCEICNNRIEREDNAVRNLLQDGLAISVD